MLSSVRAMLDQEWSTKMLRDYQSGETALLDQIFKELVEIGIVQFVREGAPSDVALLCELLGSRLLPGPVITTLAVNRATKTDSALQSMKNPKISFSCSDIVPEANQCDYAIFKGNLYAREQISLAAVESLDSSLHFFKATPKSSGERIELGEPDLLLVVIGQLIGSGEECVNMTRNYAKMRNAFGKPIGSFQAVKHKLVDSAISVEMCRSLYLGKAESSSLDATILAYVSKRISRVITDAIQIHGGVGFTTDVDLHLHLRRVVGLSKLFGHVAMS